MQKGEEYFLVVADNPSCVLIAVEVRGEIVDLKAYHLHCFCMTMDEERHSIRLLHHQENHSCFHSNHRVAVGHHILLEVGGRLPSCWDAVVGLRIACHCLLHHSKALAEVRLSCRVEAHLDLHADPDNTHFHSLRYPLPCPDNYPLVEEVVRHLRHSLYRNCCHNCCRNLRCSPPAADLDPVHSNCPLGVVPSRHNSWHQEEDKAAPHHHKAYLEGNHQSTVVVACPWTVDS
mmetsp:Transcript_11081/g.41361  ORF Transcript_11081/g.41361 Transcript_11081/m.41361 type:complete len:232 (+) Transcript_11081:4035-4730(+)